MTPVRHARNNQPIDVVENFPEWFAFFGRMRRKLRTNGAWFVVRRDVQRFYVFSKIRNPIRKFV